MGRRAGGAGQGGPRADGPALASRRRWAGSSLLLLGEAPLSLEQGARHARTGTGTLPASGEGFGGELEKSEGEEVRSGRGGGGGREDEEEEAPPEESEVVGGWLGGLGFRVEAPMGRGLSLLESVSGVLPMELRTGWSKNPAKMFVSRGRGGALSDSGSVGLEER